MSQAKLRLSQLLRSQFSPRILSPPPRVLMPGAHTRSPSPTNKPDQKRRRLISTTTATTTTTITPSPSPTKASNKYSTMTTPATPATPATPRPLALSPEEATLRKLLVDAAQEIDQDKPQDDRLVLRFTGGWVRDKLLGARSVDIDVGINNMSGYNFATRLLEYMEKYGIESRGVNKIESNPEKSKHLETATTKILGLDIDFVNLRSETYSEDSRIPHMEFGTPEKDALRRDSTINALFYNLHTELVEDFTGLGLQDLAARIIRTPLPPKETFADDPLRVLRLIRFASRLDFTIVPEAKAAMKLPEIKFALKTKISRERVGTEIEKMLKGRNPYAALSLIHELDLYNEIFSSPAQDAPSLPVQDMKIAVDIVRYPLLGYTPSHPHISKLLMTNNEKYLAWLIAAMTPWKDQPVFPADKKNMPAAATAIREGLKSPNNITGTIAKAFANYEAIRNMVAGLKDWGRGRAGLEMRALGADWKSQVGACLMFELVDLKKKNASDYEEGGGGGVMDKYEAFLEAIAAKGLEEAFNFKSLLNGKEIAAEYALAPGPWMKLTIERSLQHQLDNPHKGKDELLQWVGENRQALLDGLEYVGVGGGKK